MPLVLPNVFADNTVTNADDLSENLFNPVATGTNPYPSFDIINGQLDSTNFELDTIFSYDAVMPRQISWAREVGATINRDYFTSQTFRGNNFDVGHEPLTGLAITYYLPYTPKCIVYSWNVTAHYIGESANADAATLQLVLPSGVVARAKHSVRSCTDVAATRTVTDGEFIWNGHHMVTSGGEIQADRHYSVYIGAWVNTLGVGLGPTPAQSLRIACSSFRVIALR
jgi:hypothetical protein